MLIDCIAYQEGKKLAHIQPSKILNCISRPECFVWVAMFAPTNEELVIEDARDGHQRPKIGEYGHSRRSRQGSLPA